MRNILLPLLAGLLLGTTISLHADPAGDARRAVQANYAAIDAATARKDAAGATAFYAPDYTATDSHGRRRTAAEERQTAQQILAAGSDIASQTTLQTFTLNSPREATATTHSRLTMTLPDPKTKQPQHFALDGTGRDVWVKGAQGWRERSSQELSTTMTVNGKPVPPH